MRPTPHHLASGWNHQLESSFSTFGRSRSRLSQPRIDLSHSSLGIGSGGEIVEVLSLTRPSGGGGPRKVPMPVPPPVIITPIVIRENDARARTPPTQEEYYKEEDSLTR